MAKSLKALCLILVLVLMCGVFAGCKTNGDSSKAESDESKNSSEISSDTSSEVSVDEEAKWKDADGKYTTGIEKDDLNNYKNTFTVLVQGNAADTYQNVDFTVGEENTTTFYGTFIDEAVEERNNLVEELYGVKVIGLKNDDLLTAARNEAQASTGMFDGMVVPVGTLATLCEENKLVRLDTLENAQLDAPWWDSGATEAFSIKNKVYFTTGDITLMNKIQTTSILFNKDLIAEYNLESPYALVESKQWTFDKLIEMSKSVPENAESQVHGLLTGYNDCDGWYTSFGGTYCRKDSNDVPYLSVADETCVNVAVRILTEFSERGNFILMAQECLAPIWTTSFAEFYEGRCLFRYSGFSAANKMRDYAVNFGIVPVPMLDSNQEDYISAAGVGGGVGILTTHDNPEWVMSMFNICAAGAKNLITPAYYDVSLKTRDARDDESEEMLDLIFDHLYYDIGYVYNFGGMCDVIYNCCQNKSVAYASSLDAIKDAAQIALENAVTGMES